MYITQPNQTPGVTISTDAILIVYRNMFMSLSRAAKAKGRDTCIYLDLHLVKRRILPHLHSRDCLD